jgi:DhnA family fructose-bisphosphate aldolase class Ia
MLYENAANLAASNPSPLTPRPTCPLKIDHPGDEDALKDIVESVGAPVLVRGGPRTDDFTALLASIERAIELGVRGVVLGRNVWQSGDTELAVRELTRVVHGRS